ncbi:TetR family transcriptional regulator C-terminal domain-containing protein [Oceanicaulis sp.]|uniref:TetR family transcriptional regulator C-terminal domain-containing protein n=1 Tax=Oceanicaulis sp. TaxID=1924941 RepID=UPI003F701009
MNDTKSSRGGGRDRIFQAAAEVIYEKGLAEAQTRMVTDRAKVGTGLLNHYFKWPDLRAAAWEMIFQAVVQDLWRTGETPRGAMDRFLDEAFASEARLFWKLWLEAERLAPGDAPIAEALGRIRVQMRDRVTALLQEGMVEQAWFLRDAAATAVRLEAMRDGLAGLILSADPDMSVSQATEHLKRLFELEVQGSKPG